MFLFEYNARVYEEDHFGGGAIKLEIRARTKDKSFGTARIFHYDNLLIESVYDHISRSMIEAMKEEFLKNDS